MRWLTIEDERKEKEEEEEEDREREGVVQRRDNHKPREEERSSLCFLSLSGFSYFSGRHHSPGTRCEQRGETVFVFA